LVFAKINLFLEVIVMKRLALIALGSLAVAGTASATIVLDFENINATYPSSGYAFVRGFYNGGTSSDGTTGTNYGVAFSDNAQAICLNTPGVFCSNTSRGGLGDPNSQKGALFFLSGAQTFMDVAAGFDTGFSFYYTAINQSGSISVFDGLDGTGNLLGTINLSTTPSQCDPAVYQAGFCPFFPIGVTFSGTAKSVSFAGVANQIVFDDVTFGSAQPGRIPEPTSLALIAIGLAGMNRYRRRTTAVS